MSAASASDPEFDPRVRYVPLWRHFPLIRWFKKNSSYERRNVHSAFLDCLRGACAETLWIGFLPVRYLLVVNMGRTIEQKETGHVLITWFRHKCAIPELAVLEDQIVSPPSFSCFRAIFSNGSMARPIRLATCRSVYYTGQWNGVKRASMLRLDIAWRQRKLVQLPVKGSMSNMSSYDCVKWTDILIS